jgi:hypothetical protein
MGKRRGPVLLGGTPLSSARGAPTMTGIRPFLKRHGSRARSCRRSSTAASLSKRKSSHA